MNGVRVEPIQCSECHLPAAYIMGALVMVESHHHGHKHTTVLSVVQLKALLDKAEATLVS